jgi:argininosuccinate synthase
MKKIVLAYSGGLDTSVMLHWLKAEYGRPVLAFVADVGQDEDLEEVHRKALATGADEVVVADLRREFIEDYVFPAVQAHAVYEGEYLLGTSLARPVIARWQALTAREWGADCVAHGATGKGNDQVRFELTFQALAPDLKILAPWRFWKFRGRKDLIAYARENGIAVTSNEEKPYSIDMNIMHTSYEGGVLEDPWKAPPENIFLRTVSPEKAPDEGAEVIIEWQEGIPVAVDGSRLEPVELLEKLNSLGGKHGVGRVDIVENRMVGMKSRGVYETPGATILHRAHRALESITLDREVQRLKEDWAPKIAERIYYGFWFTPEMSVWLAGLKETQKHVSGEVRVRLHKGNCTILGRRSPFSLYDSSLASFEQEDVYTPADAEGFIRLQGLRLRSAAGRRKEGVSK